MSEILKEALRRIDRGEIIALVTIVETKGSTPRAVSYTHLTLPTTPYV